jgi:hypothetical protein
MFKIRNAMLAIALSAMAGVCAGDGDKAPEKGKPAEPRPVVMSESAPQPVVESSSCDECHRGGVFTRFWTRTVGGSIGHGLKKGAAKISSGF